jgi:predicted lipoprotein with Yx(FWY)xxD motif
MNSIRTRVTVAIAATSFAVAALAGCATTTQTGSSTTGPGSAASSPAATQAVLATASTSLGKVVVDGKGLTVYVFDKDTAGATSSACAGQCAATWPAVESDSAKPSVTGVSGTVGTISGTDGKLQVTLNGLPLYTFANDKAAGDVNGQGVGDIWWAVGSDGAKIAAASGTAATPAASSPSAPAGYAPKGNY